MIEVVNGSPTDEEIAAIIAALSCRPERGEEQGSERSRRTTAAWTLAMRYPELEIDDLRALISGDRVL